MKLAVGCSSAPDRGSGIIAYVKDLCLALRRGGHEVHLVSPAPRQDTWLGASGIFHVPGGQDDDPVGCADSILRYLQERGIEGVINNDNALLQSIAPALGCPFIAVGHMSKHSIATLACHQPAWSDYVVAISEDMQRIFVSKHGVPLAKCPVIHTGCEDRGGDCRHTVPGPDKRPMRMVFAGGFNSALKGADLILQAIAASAGSWRGMELEWFGDLPEAVRRRVSAYPFVRVRGRVPRDALMAALRDADILLLPSRYEGCPMIVIEAMSLGAVPIVSDGIGAMRWMVTHGEDGFICRLARWPSQMLEAAEFLRDHPRLLHAMKYRARASYQSRFTSDRVAHRLLELVANPTVDRTESPTAIEILRWHRPLRPDGLKAPFIDRIHYRLGHLRRAGMLGLQR